VKRRELLIAGGGLLGGLPLLGNATPCPPGSVSIDGGAGVSTACTASNALGDWNARTAAPGVLWASRFQSVSDISKWTGQAPYDSSYPTYGQFMAGQGIIPGDGCFRQQMFAGNGIPTRNPVWGRPMQPFPGDINQPGLPTINGPAQGVSTPTIWNNQQPGYILNPAYAGPHGSPVRTPSVVLGNEFYLQFRVRFSPGRLTNAGASASKMLMFETNYNNPSQELVMRAKNGSAPSAIQVYTSQGSWFNSSLAEPQGSGGGSSPDSRQPNSAYSSCSFNNSGACYNFREGVWQTVLVHWKAGLQYVSQNSATDPANAPAANTQVHIWVAQPGETNYTLIHSKTNYVWLYDNNALWSAGGGLHAWGLNWVNFNYYTGGGSWVPQSVDWYHEFDQVIFSLQPIACPSV
jgi:hypothetical protein